MAGGPVAIEPVSSTIRATTVYAVVTCCLAAGLLMGYLSREVFSTPSTRADASLNAPGPSTALAKGHVPSLADLKQMADKQAAPLLEKLKNDPNDAALLMQVGAIYHTSHQFKDAAIYYGRAVQIEPRNVGLRTKLASSLYRGGDVDGALAQLSQALSDEPTDANSLFNLGMIRLRGKSDAKGALAAWQKLLKTNPQLSPDRKAEVQKLMAEVLTTMGDQGRLQGATAHGRN